MPPHTSKDQDIVLEASDVIKVRTPGGGGYGDPFKREPALVAQDVGRAYYDRNDAADEYGVVLAADDTVDVAATERRRALRNSLHRGQGTMGQTRRKFVSHGAASLLAAPLVAKYTHAAEFTYSTATPRHQPIR